MKKTLICFVVMLFISCAMPKYKVGMIKPDGSVDTYFTEGYGDMYYVVQKHSDGTIYIMGHNNHWRFKIGEYVGWNIERIKE